MSAFTREAEIVVPFKDHNRPGTDNQPFSVTVEYGHTMAQEDGKNIVVVFRSGMKKTVREMEKGRTGYFIARKTYVFHRSEFEETVEYFNGLEERDLKTRELSLLREEFLKQYNDARRIDGVSCIRVVLDIMVGVKEFRNADRSVYLNEEDLVVSLAGLKNAPEHPFTDPLSRHDYLKRLAGDMSSINFDLSLIANDDELSHLYYLFGGTVRKIKARKSQDRTQASGLYAVIYVRDDEEACETIYLPLTDPAIQDVFHLYHTKFQAEQARENITRENDHLIKEAERDLLRVKRRLVDVETQNKLLSEKLKLKNIERTDQYEERSFQRKEQLEKRKNVGDFLKTGALVVTAILSIFQVFLKPLFARQ